MNHVFTNFLISDSKLVQFGNSGFTETNYTQLTELYQKYKDQGLSLCSLSLWLLFYLRNPLGFSCVREIKKNPMITFECSGLVILAFPCNQFLYQEPGTSQEAHEFACTRFKAEYPVFQKVKTTFFSWHGSRYACKFRFEVKASLFLIVFYLHTHSYLQMPLYRCV